MSKRLGFLWAHTQPNGDLYLSGFIEDMGGDIQIKIVKNQHRAKETHAPYVILRKEISDEAGDVAQEFLMPV